MKPTRQHYELTGKIEVTIDHKNGECSIKDSETSIYMPFDAFVELTQIAQDLKIQPQSGAGYTGDGRALVSLPPSGQIPAQPDHPVDEATERHANNVKKAEAQKAANIIQLDDIISNMWVMGKDGCYYPNSTTPGQGVQINAPIERARLFGSAEEAAEVAKHFQGCEIRLFADVGPYRIGIVKPDGAIGFWVGNGQPISMHPNNSCTVIGRAIAMSTLSTVQVPAGHQAIIIPVTS